MSGAHAAAAKVTDPNDYLQDAGRYRRSCIVPKVVSGAHIQVNFPFCRMFEM